MCVMILNFLNPSRTFYYNSTMLALSILWILLLTIIISALGVTLDTTRFVKYYNTYYSTYFEQFCQDNRTLGIYSPFSPGSIEGSIKCCRGKFLVEPFSVLGQREVKEGSQVQLPDFTFCDYNVTFANENDDFGTLMWKIYACKVKSILGNSEKKIDFKAYVEFRTINYTKVSSEHNLQKLIRDGMNKDGKGCPGGDKETVFLKKLEKYFWCFQSHEQKICEVPTEESNVTLTESLQTTRIANNRTHITCPLVPAGTRLDDFCCQGVSTPASWLDRFYTMMRVEFPWETLPNGTTVPKHSFLDCMRSSDTLMANNNTEMVHQSCRMACILNPVSFTADGSSKPEIELEFSAGIMDKYLSWFNTKAKNAIQQTVTQAKKSVNILLDEKSIKFEDAGEAWKKLTSPREKVLLYCAYYKTVDSILRSRSTASAVCHS